MDAELRREALTIGKETAAAASAAVAAFGELAKAGMTCSAKKKK